MNQIIRDGVYDQAGGLEVGVPEFEYPFSQNGDLTSFVLTRTYKQTPAAWRADKLVNRHVPGAVADPEYPDAWLISESRPTTTETGLFRFTRTFARVPSQQVEPSSMFISKPDIPGTFPQVFGDFLITKPVATIASYDAYTIKDVASDTGAPLAGYPTGGNYTLTFDGDTTSNIAYNAAAANVQTALNGLTSVSDRGNVVVAGTYNSTTGLTVTFNNYAAATVDVSSLAASTGATVAAAAISTTANGYRQTVAVQTVPGSANVSATSSLSPSGANPLTVGYSAGSVTNFSVFIGNASNLTRAVSGTFTLTVFGETTSAIDVATAPVYPNTASAASFAALIQSALNALPTVTARGGYTVEFLAFGNGLATFICRLGAPTIASGTYTVSLFGQTTASINYNDTIGTISTRLNALSEITDRGGCIVTGAGYASGQISFGIEFSNPAIVPTPALTPAGTTVTGTITDSGIGRTQSLVFSIGTAAARTLQSPVHGIESTDTIYVLAGANYYAGITDFTVTTDEVVLTSDSGAAFTDTAAITEVGARFRAGYAPGASLSRIKRVTDFYLPGVTPGISSVDDIPLPTYQGDSASLLEAIFTGSNQINYEIGELGRWRDSPILQRTLTTLNASTLT